MDLDLFAAANGMGPGGVSSPFPPFGGMGDGSGGLPPELQRALSSLQNMDERLGRLSVPLLRLQYKCGYKECFGDSGTNGGQGFFSSVGGSNSNINRSYHGKQDGEAVLSCLERCEKPMTEFSEACSTRLESLVGKITNCFADNVSNSEQCVTSVLDDVNVQSIEKDIQRNVHEIQTKYEGAY